MNTTSNLSKLNEYSAKYHTHDPWTRNRLVGGERLAVPNSPEPNTTYNEFNAMWFCETPSKTRVGGRLRNWPLRFVLEGLSPWNSNEHDEAVQPCWQYPHGTRSHDAQAAAAVVAGTGSAQSVATTIASSRNNLLPSEVWALACWVADIGVSVAELTPVSAAHTPPAGAWAVKGTEGSHQDRLPFAVYTAGVFSCT